MPDPEYKWPDAPPYEQYGTNGYSHYKTVEVVPGKWQWVRDDGAEEHEREREQSRKDLYWALRSRVLTDVEMRQVESLGIMLVIQPMVSYKEAEKIQELNAALLQQFNMRLAAERARFG